MNAYLMRDHPGQLEFGLQCDVVGVGIKLPAWTANAKHKAPAAELDSIDNILPLRRITANSFTQFVGLEVVLRRDIGIGNGEKAQE